MRKVLTYLGITFLVLIFQEVVFYLLIGKLLPESNIGYFCRLMVNIILSTSIFKRLEK